MAWSTAAINAAADAVGNLADVGTGTPTAEFGNADFSEIYLIQPLDGTNAFANAVAGVGNANIPAGAITGATNGTATHVRIKDRNGAIIDAPTAVADAIAGLISTGSGSPTLELGNSDFTVIYAILTLTSFAAATGGSASANGLPIVFTGLVDGTPTHQRWKDGNGLTVGDESMAGAIPVTTGTQYSANAISVAPASLMQALTTPIFVTTGSDYGTSSITLTQPAS